MEKKKKTTITRRGMYVMKQNMIARKKRCVNERTLDHLRSAMSEENSGNEGIEH